MRDSELLFSTVDWFSVDQHQRAQLGAEIDKIESDRLLNTSIEDLSGYFEQKYRVDVPVLRPDDIVVDQRETQTEVDDYGRRIRIKGTAVEFEVPFEGDKEVFKIRPSTYTSSVPRAEVRDEFLIIKIAGADLDGDRVRKEFDRSLNDIQSYLANLRTNAEGLNGQLRNLARGSSERRREKLLKDRNLAASLGFKIKERAGVPRTYVVPEVRRKLSPVLPPASGAPYRPEPALSSADYDHILTVIDNMAHVMERSPSAFITMDEESIRTHFLVQLNGHYEGQATGETFNYQGKTDILIRADGKNIFVAECKFWKGPKMLLETLDQLLGYTSWRDTKIALIIFNRNKAFSDVLSTIQTTVKGHTNFKRELGIRSETSFKYQFAHRDDSNRELTLTVLAFDVPT